MGACLPTLRADCPAVGGALPDGTCLGDVFAACPASGYARADDVPPGAAVVHVRPGEPASTATGSVEHPYPSLHDAVTVAPAGAWILLAPGRYVEELVLPGAQLHVLGACAARTTIEGPPARDATLPTVVVAGRGGALDLRGVTVQGPRFGVSALRGASLRLSGVRLAGNAGVALFITGAGTQATLTDVEVASTTALLPAQGGGEGIHVEAAGDDDPSLTASRTRVDGNRDAGVVVMSGRARASLDDSVVTRTRRTRDDARGYGVEGVAGATISMLRTAALENEGDEVSLTGASATLSRCALLGAAGDDAPARDAGLWAQGGSVVRAEDLVVARHDAVAVEAAQEGTRVELARVAVRDVRRATRNGSVGVGVEAQGGAAVTLTGAVIARCDGLGVVADGEGTRVDADRMVVRGMDDPPDRRVHAGVVAQRGAAVTLRRARVWGLASSGLLARDEGTQLTVSMSTVRDIRGSGVADLSLGFGLRALLGASLRATGVVVERCAGIGAAAGGDATLLRLDGCLVRGTQPLESGLFGRAVEVNQGAVRFEASRTLLEENAEVSVSLWTAQAVAELTDVVVRGTRANPSGVGVGVGVFDGGALHASRLAVARSLGAGVTAVGGAARVDALDLYVADVRSSALPVDGAGSQSAVAYGLVASLDGAMDIQRCAVDRGGFGVYNDRGVVRLRGGVIAHQADAFGVVSPGTRDEATSVVDVASVSNAHPGVIRRAGLPAGFSLEMPTLPEVPLVPTASPRP